MTNVVAVIVTAALMSGWVHSNEQVDVPADAQRVADRLSACTHFSGEINGDRSERDREVYAVMTELQCDTIDEDVSAIRNKYSGHRTIDAALDAASQP